MFVPWPPRVGGARVKRSFPVAARSAAPSAVPKRRPRQRKAVLNAAAAPILGALFHGGEGSYSAGDVVRVVGWTAKSVIVERVPTVSWTSTHHGGEATIDRAWLAARPVGPPIHKTTPTAWSMKIKTHAGRVYLGSKAKTFTRISPDFVDRWSQY